LLRADCPEGGSCVTLCLSVFVACFGCGYSVLFGGYDTVLCRLRTLFVCTLFTLVAFGNVGYALVTCCIIFSSVGLVLSGSGLSRLHDSSTILYQR